MTWTLVRKELRDLRPWGVLSVLFGLIDLLDPLFEQPDQRPLSATFHSGSAVGAVLWLVAFAIGSGLSTREEDDGTLAFLDGLPLARGRVFATKCAVTVALVLLWPLVRWSGVLTLHALSRGSLDQAFHADILLRAFGLELLLIVNAVGLGAALGRLRSLTWLVAGAVAVGLRLLTDAYPRAAVLNPVALLDGELTSAGLALDPESIAVQLALGVLGLLIGLHGFVRAGRSSDNRLARRPVIGALVAAGTVIALLTALVLWARDEAEAEQDDDDYSDGEVTTWFAPSAPAQTATRHYRFSYPAERAERALELAGEADAVFERVHALLGVPPGEPIDVDASGSSENTHGTAFFGRIRLELDSDVRVVLAHETSHVVAQRLAGGERAQLWDHAPTLNEGLATWVERHFTDDALRDTRRGDPAEQSGALVLAALHVRRELVLEELADLEQLAQLRDENLKYPAGQALIAATVQLYGAPALPRLLRAFADPRLPRDLHGLSLWQASFQLAGMDLGAVENHMFRAVALVAHERADELAALARPRVRLVRVGEVLGVQPLLDGEPAVDEGAAPLVLRFRPAPDSGREMIETKAAYVAKPVWRDPRRIRGGRICVQPGLVLPDRQVLYEAWICLPTADAEPWTAEAGASDEP